MNCKIINEGKNEKIAYHIPETCFGNTPYMNNAIYQQFFIISKNPIMIKTFEELEKNIKNKFVKEKISEYFF